MTRLPSVLAQVDPAVVASIISGGPTGIATGAVVVAVYLFWQNQSLHSKHVELLQQILPISTKLGEAVERLERRLDRLEKQP